MNSIEKAMSKHFCQTCQKFIFPVMTDGQVKCPYCGSLTDEVAVLHAAQKASLAKAFKNQRLAEAWAALPEHDRQCPITEGLYLDDIIVCLIDEGLTGKDHGARILELLRDNWKDWIEQGLDDEDNSEAPDHSEEMLDRRDRARDMQDALLPSLLARQAD